jgi:hypothetical protein
MAPGLTLEVNMGLSKEEIQEFKEAYFKEFGERISDNEACEKFLRLINLLRAILKQPPTNGERADSSGPLSVDERDKNAKLKE